MSSEITHINKIVLRNPRSGDVPEEICWHNMKVADEFFELNFFMFAAHAWLNLNIDKNFQDLEKELRARNFNTHLIAKKNNRNNPDVELKLHGQEMKYEIIFSCRPPEYALKEVLLEWSSYRENFENLSNTGLIVCDTDNLEVSGRKIHKFSDKEGHTNVLILENKKKITIEKIPIEDHLTSIINHYQNNLGKTLEQRIVALTMGGCIIGYFVDDQLISPYCFIINQINPTKKIYLDIRGVKIIT